MGKQKPNTIVSFPGFRPGNEIFRQSCAFILKRSFKKNIYLAKPELRKELVINTNKKPSHDFSCKGLFTNSDSLYLRCQILDLRLNNNISKSYLNLIS